MICINDKYSMSQEKNIFLAKRLLVDVVYKSANLEGIAVTYANTVDILNDVGVEKLKPSEISKVFCLRDAWHYVLDNINTDVNLGFLQSVHEIVARYDVSYNELGKLRSSDDILVSGTLWRPDIPNAEKLHFELQELLKIPVVTDRAISVMLWIMRSQMFADGNKRVASMAGNKILIQNGRGIFSVPVELDGTFKTMLVKYYETNDMRSLKEWIYENCIDGVNSEVKDQVITEETENEEGQESEIQ